MDEAEEFFQDHPDGLAVYRAVAALVDELEDVTVQVTKSQIAFRRRKGFAYVWRPGQYVRSEVPAVVTFALRERLDSSRFKQIVHPSANVWVHHLEVDSPDEVDEQVRAWLERAWAEAV